MRPRSSSPQNLQEHTESKPTATGRCGSSQTRCTCAENAPDRGREELIECETLRGFHASLGRGDPCTQWEERNRKMARTPFCSQVFFLCHSALCVIQSAAKNPGAAAAQRQIRDPERFT